jgi:hypothetical protein
MRLLACMLLLAGLAAADDVSGKWSGTFTPDGRDASNAYLVLKQNGGELTGTAGPDENQQWTISKGKVEGNIITAEVPSPDGPVYKLSMVLEGDHLKGDVTASNPDGGNMTGKIDLTRVK